MIIITDPWKRFSDSVQSPPTVTVCTDQNNFTISQEKDMSVSSVSFVFVKKGNIVLERVHHANRYQIVIIHHNYVDNYEHGYR